MGLLGLGLLVLVLQFIHAVTELIQLGLADLFRNDATVASCLPAVQDAVRAGRMTPFAASRELLVHFELQKDTI